MIKCYHARRVELVVDSEPQLFYEGPVIVPLIAEIDSDKEDLEDIWDCCNNSCWYDRAEWKSMTCYKDKFNVKFTDDYFGYCNDDLIVEMDGTFHIAKSCGWDTADSLCDAINYCKKHSHWCRLSYKNYQHPEGRELTINELYNFKLKYEKEGLKCFLIHADQNIIYDGIDNTIGNTKEDLL